MLYIAYPPCVSIDAMLLQMAPERASTSPWVSSKDSCVLHALWFLYTLWVYICPWMRPCPSRNSELRHQPGYLVVIGSRGVNHTVVPTCTTTAVRRAGSRIPLTPLSN